MKSSFPVLGPEHADCTKCELKPQCHDRGQRALAAAPLKSFNQIMIVGEGPGGQEVSAGRPFVGRPGQLLRALLKNAGIDMDACYLTFSVLGKPPYVAEDTSKKKGLHERFPNAIHGCLSRLEKEIAAVRPRVILALGNAALISLTGYEVEKKKRVAFACEHCNSARKVGPVFVCGKCKVNLAATDHLFEDSVCVDCACAEHEPKFTDYPEVCAPPPTCPWCDANTSKLKPKMVKCSECRGLKTREEIFTHFVHDYTLAKVAGMVVPGEKFGWSDLGVKYVIPTFTPGFLMRPVKSEGSGDKKVMAGQFAAYAVVKHFEKACVLAKEDRDWSFEYDVSSGYGEEAAQHLQSFIDDVLATKEHEISFDIETKAEGCAYYCDVCNKKSKETVEKEGIDFTEGDKCQDGCPNCNTITEHTLEYCELDARELEEVSQIKCIGFASLVLRRAFVVDTREMPIGSPLWCKLKWLLAEEQELGKVAHHGTYDVPVINKLWGFWCSGYSGDTLIKHHETHTDETHTLEHLAARYTYARLWKPPTRKRGAAKHEDFDELAEYNARDVMVTSEASYALDIEIRREKFEKLRDLDMKLQLQALTMQQNGMPLDQEAAIVVGNKALKEQRAALDGMRRILNNDAFNPNSPAQLQEALYKTLGFTVTDWTDGGKSQKRQPATSRDALVKLPDTPFKRFLLDYREYNSTIRSFFEIELVGTDERVARPGKSLNLWADGRVHATWKPFGTVTGRFSSSPNFQNWQGWLKKMVKCQPGRKIVGSDYDQLELRTLAILSGDTELLHRCLTADDKRKLEPDHDPHSFVASHVFPHYVTLSLNDPAHIKDPDPGIKCRCQTCHRKNLRDLCKRVIYGLNYGAGEDVVLASIYKGGYYGPPVSTSDIRIIKQTIFTVFPGILAWREDMVRMAQDTRELRDVFHGRRREFALGDIPITEIANFPIQSSSAAIVNEQSTLFFEKSKKIDPTSMYLAQIHDAIYYEVDERRAEDFAEEMSLTLTVEKRLGGSERMLFSSSASIADNLKDAA